MQIKEVYVLSIMIKTGVGYKEQLISIHATEEQALLKGKEIKKLQRTKQYKKLECLMIDEFFTEAIVYSVPLNR